MMCIIHNLTPMPALNGMVYMLGLYRNNNAQSHDDSKSTPKVIPPNIEELACALGPITTCSPKCDSGTSPLYCLL